MKKLEKIIFMFVIFILGFALSVSAADEVCKITMNADKSTLKPGDVVTVTLTASDIAIPEGIGTFLAEFKYNSNIFELVVEENEELKAAISQIEGMSGFEKSEVLYSGLDNITTNSNPWYMLYFESSGEKAVFGSALTALKNTQEIGKIKLKVKDGVTATTEKIEFGTIVVVDGLALDTNQSASAKEYTISGANVNLTIKPTSNSGSNQQIPQVSTNKEQNSNTSNNKVQTNNQATGEAPNTGVEDYLPFVFIIITIGTFSYIKYKKYKDIY